jgi:uncharacterized protein (DUF169 family)
MTTGETLDAQDPRIHRLRNGYDGHEEGCRMQAEPRDSKVYVSMTMEEALSLLHEIDKWPELPQVERDLVDALKTLPQASSGPPGTT